jgi:mono/diheme cytochrome c family protein
MTNTAKWKHPPAVDKHTAQQLADIVAYIRYAVTGVRQPVDPSDVQ